ncbi:MAG: hypothetical protein OXC95_02570 [Dehalococcoidia bacterium]|nr:hypothetical protein [Dehalococcoidia bacterium]
MPTFKNFQEIASHVQDNGGVVTLAMEDLRNAHGAGKLGKNVLKGIDNNLAGNGLGHWPKDLPGYAYEAVRLYALGSRFAEYLSDLDDLSEEADVRLREIFNDDMAKTIQSIRELVCD